MEIAAAFLGLIALAGIPLGLIVAVVNKIRKKSAKKALWVSAISVAVFLAASSVPLESSQEQSISVEPYKEKDEVLIESSEGQNEAGETEEALAAEVTSAAPGMNKPLNTEPLDREPLDSKSDISDLKQNEKAHDKAEYIGTDLWLSNTTDFSEGRAWVQFKESDRKGGSVNALEKAVKAATGNDLGKVIYGLQNLNMDGNNRAALIDATGKMLWESELTNKDYVLLEKSTFQQGATYCLFNGNEQSMYYIIDSDGNTTFTRECTDDFLILACGDGLFLVAEHVSNFDTDEWQLGVMDKNGEMISPLQRYEMTLPSVPNAADLPAGDAPDPNVDYWGCLKYQEQLAAYEEYENYPYSPVWLEINKDTIRCEYLGENVYRIYPDGWQSILLNMESRQTIYTDYAENKNGYMISFITGFKNGAASILYQDNEEGQMVCSLTKDGTITPIVTNDWAKRDIRPDMKFSEGLAFVEYDQSSDGFVHTDGTIYRTGVYCNLHGDAIIEFPQYNGKHLYHCSPFQKGYASINIQGADSIHYITAINKNGDLMFEPKPGFDVVSISRDGKYITAIKFWESIQVFSIDGTPKVTVYDTEASKTYAYDDRWELNNFDTRPYTVCDGLLRVSECYINVEDGTVIGLPRTNDRNFRVKMNESH